MEAFYTGGTKSGALVRQVSTDPIDTPLAFQVLDGPLVHLEQSTLLDKSPLDWTKFWFSDHLDGIVTEGSRDNWVTGRNGLPAERSVSAIPSSAAHVILTSSLRTAAESVDFEQFAEGDRNTTFRASFVRKGREEILVPGATIDAEKVSLDLDGHVTNTFWVEGQTVVKSDWNGAESYPSRSQDETVEGLTPPIIELMKAFVHSCWHPSTLIGQGEW